MDDTITIDPRWFVGAAAAFLSLIVAVFEVEGVDVARNIAVAQCVNPVSVKYLGEVHRSCVERILGSIGRVIREKGKLIVVWWGVGTCKANGSVPKNCQAHVDPKISTASSYDENADGWNCSAVSFHPNLKNGKWSYAHAEW
jgi:hypothetical protein